MFQVKFDGLNERQIGNIERQLKVRLPEEYKSFLRSVGGGVVEKDKFNQIILTEINEKIVLDVLYGDDKRYENANIMFWMSKFDGELLEDAIIIGDDILHGFFVMICDGENQGVYYWDDSYHFEYSDDENNMYWIADTFGSFMKLIGFAPVGR